MSQGEMETTTQGQFPAAIQAHLGTWEGSYTYRNAESGQVEDRHKCKIEVSIRGDKYAQRNTYSWEDGRVKELKFFGGMKNGRLVIDGEGLTGFGVPLNEVDLVFCAEKKSEGKSFVDVIKRIGEHDRARSWQVFDGERFCTLVDVVERRVCTRDVYDDIV